MMRKILCLLAAAALASAVCGCGSGSGGASSADSSAESLAAASAESSVDSSADSSEASSAGQSEAENPASSGGEAEAPSAPSSAVPLPVDTPDAFANLDNERRGWGQGLNVDEANRPISCLQYNEKYGQYGALFIGPAAQSKTFYLTFDEGYENGYTSAILDTLREKNVPAMFFVTYDYVRGNPELVQRMIDEGHVVGNHSMSHPSMPTVSTEKAAREISGLHDYVQENFHYTMRYFRPPQGEFSVRTLALTQSLGYKSVFWSFAYLDYDVNKQPDPDAAMKRIYEARHSGAIYLLHAVSKTNTQILGELIDRLRDDGYEFCKFDL